MKGGNCCGQKTKFGSGEGESVAASKICVELLYIEQTLCARCTATEAVLDDAVRLLVPVLEELGYGLEVNKTLVETEEQAKKLGLVSSPTVRVNGRDIQGDIRENACSCCGDIAGVPVDCRVWLWQGNEYENLPKGVLLDAVLRQIYGTVSMSGEPEKHQDVPVNLRRFFSGKGKKQSGSCCDR